MENIQFFKLKEAIYMKFMEIKSSSEIDSLVELIQEIWPEAFIPIIGKDQVDYMLLHYHGKKVITDEIKCGTRYFFIKDSGRVIGYFAYSLEEDHLAVNKIYLKKEFRGLGLSSKIFSYFEETAVKNKKGKLVLNVNRLNKQAIAVYLRCGFKIIKNVDQPIGGGFFLNDFRMEKKIELF